MSCRPSERHGVPAPSRRRAPVTWLRPDHQARPPRSAARPSERRITLPDRPRDVRTMATVVLDLPTEGAHAAGWTETGRAAVRLSGDTAAAQRRQPCVSWSSRRQSTAPLSRSRPRSATSWLGPGSTRPSSPWILVPSVNGYDGVVVGSGIYAGHWLGSARQFVDDHAMELAVRPLGCSPAGRSERAQARGRSGRRRPIAARTGRPSSSRLRRSPRPVAPRNG